jgi:hypothetical protein
VRHGTTTGYNRHRCRCEECTRAQREYMRFYRGSKVDAPMALSPAARERAVRRLIEQHPDDYQRLIEDEAAREVAS